MKHLFLDTCYLIAFLLTDDAYHDRAVAWQERIDGVFVTTESILVELLDALAKSHRDLALAAVAEMKGDPDTIIVPASTQLMDAGTVQEPTRQGMGPDGLHLLHGDAAAQRLRCLNLGSSRGLKACGS